jgi:hypothetical protein
MAFFRQDLFSEANKVAITPLLGDAIKSISITQNPGQGMSLSMTYVKRGLLTVGTGSETEPIGNVTVRGIEFIIENVTFNPTNTGIDTSISGVDIIQKVMSGINGYGVSYTSSLTDAENLIWAKAAQNKPKPIIRWKQSKDKWGTGGWTLHSLLEDFWENVLQMGNQDPPLKLQIMPEIPDVTIGPSFIIMPGATIRDALLSPIKQVLSGIDSAMGPHAWGEYSPDGGERKVIIALGVAKTSDFPSHSSETPLINKTHQSARVYKSRSNMHIIGGVGPHPTPPKGMQPDCATLVGSPQDLNVWPDCGEDQDSYSHFNPEVYKTNKKIIPDSEEGRDIIKGNGGDIVNIEYFEIPGLPKDSVIKEQYIERYSKKYPELNPITSTKTKYTYCFPPNGILKVETTIWGRVMIGQGGSGSAREYTEDNPFGRIIIRYNYKKTKDDKLGTTIQQLQQVIKETYSGMYASGITSKGENTNNPVDPNATKSVADLVNPVKREDNEAGSGPEFYALVFGGREVITYHGDSITSSTENADGTTISNNATQGRPIKINKADCYAFAKENFRDISIDKEGNVSDGNNGMGLGGPGSGGVGVYSPILIGLLPDDNDMENVVAIYKKFLSYWKKKDETVVIGGVWWPPSRDPNISATINIDYVGSSATTRVSRRLFLDSNDKEIFIS